MSKSMDDIERGEITRRAALQLGASAGAASLFLPGTAKAQQYPEPPPPPPQPTPCTTRPANSPPTRPFLQQLPIPLPPLPRLFLTPAPTVGPNLNAGEAPRAAHQRWNEFLPKVLYDVRARPAMHRFHPDLPETYIWGFDGRFPGPTFLSFYDFPALVRIRNDLPVDHVGFGINEITVHLHNGHTGSESDGFASDYYGPGLWKDFHYPNVLAGYDQYPPKGDPREAMHTLWYHDHRHSFTSPNSYRGLVGMYFLFDDKDTGNEYDPRPSALRLPGGYGLFDIPLILADKLFCADGQLFSANPGGVPLGDKFTVNGAIQPHFRVFRRKYRFRLLNAGPTRIYSVALSNGAPLKVIATDGNLLRSAIDVPSIQVNVAERFDVVIDFSTMPTGTKLYLTNNQAQFVGNSPEPQPIPGLPVENILMRFDVVGNPPVPDNSRVPSILCEYPPLNLAEVARTRTWDFDLVSGQFLVNNQVFDPDTSLADIRTGTTERWILRNKLPLAGWVHPVHIHFEEFRTLSRNGAPPPPLETGRKDVIRLNGNDEVEIFMRFRDFRGKYMIHCHNMNHEDNFMLVRWTIGDNFPA
jgi:FtsP/CotA-like multicopper oxidase with cupredoxin domain